MKIDPATNKTRTGTVFVLLVLLILSTYSNTFQASFQFDDKPNIVDNQRLHLTDLSPASIWGTFFAQAGKDSFSRPLPSLSLALNWYAGKEDTFGYHLVNTTIHILTALFLFLSVSHLLKTPRLKDHYTAGDIYFISLLSTVLWAVNPIQIQAVTYIVQRMASMAALFYIIGIYFYLRGRQSNHIKHQFKFLGACGISFVCALMSKENAVMMPASLFLIEVIFYRDLAAFIRIRKHVWLLTVTGIVVIFVGIALLKIGVFDFIFNGYETRPFTLWERLLTEPRIVLFYISQIFYPLPGRFSITHDIIFSNSLLSPWTTFPAILAILVIVCAGVWQINKRPVVAFSILFFFINHVIESTVLPLEPIFEHRNYLPSFFVFLPVATGLRYLFNFYKSKNHFIYALMVIFVPSILIGLGCFTYVRNSDWRTETTLWQDAMKKAPQDARPLSSLAIQLAWGTNNPTPLQYDVALAMLEKALTLNTAHNFLVSDIFDNIGIIYYHQGEYQKAVETYRKGLEINPGFLKMRYDLISSLVMMGRWKEGSEEADRLIRNEKNYIESDYYKLKGFILLWQNQPEESLTYFRKALEMEPNNKAVLLNAGVALSLMGESSSAELFLKKASEMTSGDIRPAYALIENSVRSGDMQKANKYAEKMFSEFRIQVIINGLDLFVENYRTAPMSPELITPVVKKTLMRLIENLDMPMPATMME